MYDNNRGFTNTIPPRSTFSPPSRPSSAASQRHSLSNNAHTQPHVHSPLSVSSPPPLSSGLSGPSQALSTAYAQQQTISLLVSEKATLAAQLEKLQDEESRKLSFPPHFYEWC